MPYTISYLIVAGGGGGHCFGGGGGAGGVLSSSIQVYPNATYNFVVGTSAQGVTDTSNILDSIGKNSIAFGLTAVGGGASYATSGPPPYPDRPWPCDGGSGAGSNMYNSNQGLGTLTQGNSGGDGFYTGGGGGAGAPGGWSTGNNLPGGNGGMGIINPVAGSTVGQLSAGNYWIAGGGGGGCNNNNVGGTGGLGGGGAGKADFTKGGNGVAYTGGGGGGTSGYSGSPGGGDGGSGVVVLSIPTAKYTGITTGAPQVLTSGSNTVLQYLKSGSYTT